MLKDLKFSVGISKSLWCIEVPDLGRVSAFTRGACMTLHAVSAVGLAGRSKSCANCKLVLGRIPKNWEFWVMITYIKFDSLLIENDSQTTIYSSTKKLLKRIHSRFLGVRFQNRHSTHVQMPRGGGDPALAPVLWFSLFHPRHPRTADSISHCRGVENWCEIVDGRMKGGESSFAGHGPGTALKNPDVGSSR